LSVTEHLHFDVPWALQEPLHEALATPERRDGLPGGGVECFRHVGEIPHDLQSSTAAAERRLDRDRQAMLFGERDGLGRPRERPIRSSRERRIDLQCDPSCGDLVTQRIDAVRGRADPDETRALDGAREFRALREESVSRVHGIRP
jgi:hypothetical protein